MNFKSYSTILSGTVIAQLINIVSLLVFARLYEPSDFGLYQIYFSVMNVLLMVACYRYEVSLLNVQEGSDLNILVRLIFYLCLLNAVILCILIMAFGDFFETRFKIPKSALYIFPFALVFGGIYQALSYFPIRNQHYSLAGSHKISQASGFLGIGLILGNSSISHIGLIFGDMFGRLFATVHILISYVKSSELFPFKREPIKIKKYLNSARKNIDSLTFIFPGTLLSSLVALMLPLYLANQFSIDILGQYSLVERFLLAPCTILAVAISQVVTGNFAAQVRAKSPGLQRRYRDLVAFLIVMSSLFAIFCWFFIPTIFYFFFGEEWTVAGNLAKYSIFYVAVVLVASPVNMLLIVSGKQWQQLIWEIFRFVLMAGFFLTLNLYVDFSLENALISLGAVSGFCYLIFLIAVDKVMAEIDQAYSN